MKIALLVSFLFSFGFSDEVDELMDMADQYKEARKKKAEYRLKKHKNHETFEEEYNAAIEYYEPDFYEKHVCKPLRNLAFEPKITRDRSTMLSFCYEHEANTCCVAAHTDAIRNQLNHIEPQNTSKSCIDKTEEIFCSQCDGDVGVGTKKGICLGLCEQWYKSCETSLFYEFDEGERMDFCDLTDQENGECHQADEITSSASEFCKLLDFEVIEDGNCYDGTPKASVIPLSKNRLNKESQKTFRETGLKKNRTEEDNYKPSKGVRQATVDLSFWDVAKMSVSGLKFFGAVAMFGSMLFACFFGIYQANNQIIEKHQKMKQKADLLSQKEKKKQEKQKQKEVDDLIESNKQEGANSLKDLAGLKQD